MLVYLFEKSKPILPAQSSVAGDGGSANALIRSKRSKTVIKFQALALSKPEKDGTTQKPYILHLIAKNTCGRKKFSSNVYSRYLTCGLKPAVNVETFATQLMRKIR